MRLLKVHIENFGVLHDFSMEFDGSYHVICEPNGFGKSTLAAFIRVMFYGFLGESKRNPYENERKRFYPWQGGVYGGTLDFEVNNKKYSLTRIFQDKPQNDQFSLRDLDSNLVSSDYSENIGQELFLVDAASFVRTVFMGQSDLVTNTTDDINAKIGNLTDNTNDLNSFEVADKHLTDYINGLSPRRKTGTVYKLKEQEEELSIQLRGLLQIEEAMEKQEELIIKAKTDVEALKKQQEEIRQKQILAGKKTDILSKQEMYEHLCEEAEQKKAEYLTKAEEIEKKLPNEDALKELEKLESLTETDYQEITAKKSLLENQGKGKAGAYLISSVVVGILMCLLSILLLMNKQVLGWMLLLPAVAVFCVGGYFFRQSKKNNRNLQEELQKLWETYDSHIEKLGAQLAQYGIHCEIDNYHQEIADLSRHVASEKTVCEILEKNYQDAKKKCLEFFKKHQQLIEDKADGPEDLEALNNAYQECSSKLEKLYQDLRDYQGRLEYLQEQADSLCEKQQKMEELHQMLVEKEKLHTHLQKTQSYLRQAKENMTQKYVKPLKNSFETYCRFITEDLENACFMDANAKVTINKSGMQRDTDYFSAGYQDFMGLCMRFAFADAMYPHEKPMLILDDVFANLDQEKIEGGKKLLEEMSEKYQIIYFTCHGSRI